MKEIKLINGKFTQVDDEDFEYLNQWRWSCKNKGTELYAQARIGTKVIAMHRVIMKCSIGDGKIIDHKDMNGLNNQKSNLRFATKAQNNANKKCQSNKVGGVVYLGVYRHITKNIRKPDAVFYTARIRTKHLGSFKTQLDAAKAYNEAAKKYHGEFARLNPTE